MGLSATLAGHVQVSDHAVIGHCAGVRQFCKIGFGAFIDRLAPINKDVMALTIVVAFSQSVRHQLAWVWSVWDTVQS